MEIENDGNLNAARRKQLTIDEKAKILVLNAQGKTEHQIALEIGRNRSTVSRVIARWRNSQTIKRKHGTGLVRKTTPEQDNDIVTYALNNRFEIIES
ncbi:uncharacterized protein B4U80_14715, partial [Leptotrombidium deliense]